VQEDAEGVGAENRDDIGAMAGEGRGCLGGREEGELDDCAEEEPEEGTAGENVRNGFLGNGHDGGERRTYSIEYMKESSA